MANKIYWLYTLYQIKKYIFLINNYIKIDYLMKFIEKFNCLTYNNEYEYLKNKLLSLDLFEIQYIMFFKKLHVLFNNLPSHIKKIVKIIKGIYTILMVY